MSREKPVPEQASELERLTINLQGRARADLADLVAKGRANKTDIMNKAISVLRIVEDEIESGSEVMFRRTDGKEVILLIV